MHKPKYTSLDQVLASREVLERKLADGTVIRQVVEGMSPCLERTVDIGKNGYGAFSLGQSKKTGRRRIYGHRLAWLLFKGPIPDGLWVLHKCHNRCCANYEHLYLGDVDDNARDMVEVGHQSAKLHPELILRGEKHPNALLTEMKVVEMRERYAAGGVTPKHLAREYVVDRSTVHCVLRGKLWPHAGGPIAKDCSRKMSPLLSEIIRVNWQAGTPSSWMARWFSVHKKTVLKIAQNRGAYAN